MMTKVTFEDVFDGLQILPSRDDTEGKFIDILEKQKELMEFAIANHSKVMQIRFDLHYPSDGFILPSSDDISVFSYNLSRRLKRMVIATHRVDPLYLWVREIHDSSFSHYHFLLWINANAIKNKFTVFDMANKIWKNTLKTNEEGLVHYCLNKKRDPEYDNGITLDRNKEDFSMKRDVAFRSGSYLSKTFSKDALDKYAWRYGYSRLPRG
ncbi:YagK/YfjJ domain-containing protein [Bilophila wadsworthia]|uniref:YagK/YfjJ domain-containing protein n=1 Tax=Bilophila wadsworthia TaxID=35833 RepID=UPI00242FDCDD|nr:inovirus-type Gp2 protein [Bilophila wadsworthia]